MSTTNFKKTFVPLMALLHASKEMTVGDLLPQIEILAMAKGRSTSGEARESAVIRNSENAVVAIRDYYFQRFMPIVGDLTVEFGVKNSTTSGLNTMCKEGQAHWNKQQATAKKALSDILLDVENGDLAISEISERKLEIEQARNDIMSTELGFATREELVEYLEEECGEDLTPYVADESTS